MTACACFAVLPLCSVTVTCQLPVGVVLLRTARIWPAWPGARVSPEWNRNGPADEPPGPSDSRRPPDRSTAVSSTNFTTGGGTPVETIPAGDATYAITGLSTATGPATFTHVSMVNLSGSPQAVVSATNVTGNTAVSWNPLIQVAVPGGAVGGTYTATITHSAS